MAVQIGRQGGALSQLNLFESAAPKNSKGNQLSYYLCCKTCQGDSLEETLWNARQNGEGEM